MDGRHFGGKAIRLANALDLGCKGVESRMTPSVRMSYEGIELPVSLAGAGLGNLVQDS